jgi:hypothetical protein
MGTYVDTDDSTKNTYAKYTESKDKISDNQKYDYDSKDAAGNPEIRSLRPRYNDMNDGLEHDNKMYLEEEKNLFYASVLTMTTLLISAIYISSR